jgi:hypothetical protein
MPKRIDARTEQAILIALATTTTIGDAYKQLRGEGYHDVSKRTVSARSHEKAAEIERLPAQVPQGVKDRITQKTEKAADELLTLVNDLTHQAHRDLREGKVRDAPTALYRVSGALANAKKLTPNLPDEPKQPRQAAETYRKLDGVRPGLGQAIRALLHPWDAEAMADINVYLGRYTSIEGTSRDVTPQQLDPPQEEEPEAKPTEPSPPEPDNEPDTDRERFESQFNPDGSRKPRGDTYLVTQQQDEPFGNGDPNAEGP